MRKEKALLDFFNWTLDKLGKEHIDKITDYIIYRKELIDKLDITKYKEEWENIIFPAFTKSEVMYFKHKKMGPIYIITLIKYCASSVGKNVEIETFKSTKYTIV